MSLNKERILSKIDELNNYLEELTSIIPSEIEIYNNLIKDKRACERLLQLCIESVVDVCNIIISNLKLGIPSEEDEVFKKLSRKKIISKELEKILIGMKGLRNILVHKYGEVDDEIVYEVLTDNLADFEKFKEEILEFLKKRK
jgi:uncharacterized protein YutE (UPF0331/DUF86 family)